MIAVSYNMSDEATGLGCEAPRNTDLAHITLESGEKREGIKNQEQGNN